jgi:hypothetical protein
LVVFKSQRKSKNPYPGIYYYVDPKGKNGEGKKTKQAPGMSWIEYLLNSALLNAKNAIHVDPTSYQIIAPRIRVDAVDARLGEKDIQIPTL